MTVRHAFAHRGGRAHGGDNTLATFRTALDLGATGLETDAWLTADGAVVLDHDGVHRQANRLHTPLAQVHRGDLPAHIPSLDELYESCGTDFDLAIDVRLAEVARAILDIAADYNAESRLWLVGGTDQLVAAWHDYGSAAHLAMSVTVRERGRETVRRAHHAGADAVNMRWPWWTRGMVQHVHDEGLLAFGYDAQRLWSLKHCVRIGLDGIFSDHVDRMLTATSAAA